MMSYDLKEKNLIIEDLSTGEVVWQGHPYGCSVEKIMPLLEQTGCIVLLNRYEFSQSEYRHTSNLINISTDGKILWAAQLPETRDVYVDFEWEENMLVANSWSCFRVQLDIKTGRILNRIFTK